MTRLEQLFDGTLPRLVMFDLDGTLMDSVPDLAAAVDKMLMLLGRGTRLGRQRLARAGASRIGRAAGA